ncbi:MAG: hypothetical protein N3A54_06370 [Patescibacteria group bacterium]|nr:hypothetical protein [Patescibacteria group bacterium]
MPIQLIRNEKFANIQRAQSGLAKLLQEAAQTSSFYRVLRNDKPLGVLIPNNLWEDILEDLEAVSSPLYLSRIKKSRRSKKRYSLTEVKQELGV